MDGSLILSLAACFVSFIALAIAIRVDLKTKVVKTILEIMNKQVANFGVCVTDLLHKIGELEERQ